MNMIKAGSEAAYRAKWETKTDKQIESERKSWRAHFKKHEGHYFFHGATANPSELTDGERVMILNDILRERA